jgi:hypothetical protein
LTFGTFLGDVSYDMTTIGYIGGGDVDVSWLFWSWQDPPRPVPLVLPPAPSIEMPLHLKYELYVDALPPKCWEKIGGHLLATKIDINDVPIYDLNVVGNQSARDFFGADYYNSLGLTVDRTVVGFFETFADPEKVRSGAITVPSGARPGIFSFNPSQLDTDMGLRLHEMLHWVTQKGDDALAGELNINTDNFADASEALDNWLRNGCE